MAGTDGYHTKFEQDLESFWKQEKQYRLTKPGSDQMLEAFAGENQNTRYCNGYFVFCLTDSVGTTLEDYVNVMPTRAEEFARYEAALWQLQEKIQYRARSGIVPSGRTDAGDDAL